MTTWTKTKEGKERSSASETKRSSIKHQSPKPGRSEQARKRSEMGSKEHPLLQLQQSHGNQAVQRLVKERILPKLEVGQPNNKYEREADRVAEQVIGMPDPVAVERPEESELGARVQRMCSRCQSRLRQEKPLNCTDCEQELQRKEAGPESPSPGGDVERRIQSSRGGGRPLPESVRSSFEPRFGHDFTNVRIHDNARAAELNNILNARAFTYGQNIYFAQGNYRPETLSGKQLLAHELTHVVQQHNSRKERISRQEDQPSAILPPRQSTTYRAQSNNSIYRIQIRGHASPRWRSPDPLTPAQRNLELSQRRAEAVEDALRTLFFERSTEFSFTCVADEHGSSIETSAVGQEETFEEAGGDLDANHPELRRVDVIAEVEETAQTTAGMSQMRTLPTATTRWAIRVDFVTSGGEGVYASGGMGVLKNRETGQEVRGGWIAGGGGAGVELPIPAVPPSPSWSNFLTDSPVTFDSFEDAIVRFTHVDVGIGVAGYSFAYLSFTDFMDEGVSVSDFVMNQWGIGGSVTAGKWQFEDPIPAPPTITEEIHIPIEVSIGTSIGHRLYFRTGSAVISNAEYERLKTFVDALP